MTTLRVPEPGRKFIQGPPDAMFETMPVVRGFFRSLYADLHQAHGRVYGDELVWIAGGALRCAVRGESPRDVDLFFDNSSLLRHAQRYIPEHCDCKVIDENEIVVKLEVRLAPALRDLAGAGFVKVDLVKRYHGTALHTARSMDFVCCSAALSRKSFVRHEDFEADAAAKVLRINAPWRPRSSWRRMERFLERGWTISDAERDRLKAMADDWRLPAFDFSDGAPKDGWDY